MKDLRLGDVRLMNKKEIAAMRKEFKDNSYKLNLSQIYNVYLKKDGGTVIHTETNYFDSFELEKKELYFNNFKKILSSALDTKLFELEFLSNEEGTAPSLMYSALNTEDKLLVEEELNKLLQKLAEDYTYENDVMLTFVKGTYLQGKTKRNAAADEAEEDEFSTYNFILGSINKIEFPKKTMIFDYANRRIEPNSSLEITINLNAPLDGFVFPAINNGYADVNKVMYYSSKAKEMNRSFVENVLNAKLKPTARDEKEFFHSILANVIGDSVKPEVIHDIYVGLSEKVKEEDEEQQLITPKDIEEVLKLKGIEDTKNIEMAYEEVCGSKCDFKIENIIPDFNSKSIKISSETAEITLTPKDLSLVKQVRNKKGNKCILIEITEDLEINGLKLQTEEDLEVI
jgi:hypothetical protein